MIIKVTFRYLNMFANLNYCIRNTTKIILLIISCKSLTKLIKEINFPNIVIFDDYISSYF